MDSYQIVRNRIESTKDVTYRLRLKQRSIMYEIMLSLILNEANVRKLEHPELVHVWAIWTWLMSKVHEYFGPQSFTKRKKKL